MKVPRHSGRLKSERIESNARTEKTERRHRLFISAVTLVFYTALEVTDAWATWNYPVWWVAIPFEAIAIVTGMLALTGVWELPDPARIITVVFMVVIIITMLTTAIFSPFTPISISTNTYEHNLTIFKSELSSTGYTLNYTGLTCSTILTFIPTQFMGHLNSADHTIYVSNSTSSTSFMQYGDPFCHRTIINATSVIP